MARYSSIKYGGASVGGAKYGTAVTTTNQLWTAIIAWNGFYTGENEGQRMIDLQIRRGRANFLAPNGQGFERYQPGVAVLTLDNSDGRYDPFNASSPLYPNVTLGKYARIEVKNGNTGTNYSLMRGTVSNIENYTNGFQRLTRITISDGLQLLADTNTDIELTTNATFGELVENVILSTPAPVTEWDILSNHNGNVIPYFWAMSQNALDIIRQLEDAEIGAFIHTRTGGFRWIASDTAALTTITLTQAEIKTDISTPMPWEVARNEINIPYRPFLRINNDVIVYQLNEPIAIAGFGGEVTIRALFTRNGVPVVGEGRVLTSAVWSNSDGTGFTIPHTATMGVNYGYGTNITVRTDPGSGAGYITTLYINADTTVNDFGQVIQRSSLSSQLAYGRKQLTVDSIWMQRQAIATINADALLAALRTPQQTPTIMIENRPTLQFPIDLNNRTLINLSIAAMNVAATDFRVGSIEHKWLQANGQATLTTVRLEPNFPSF